MLVRHATISDTDALSDLMAQLGYPASPDLLRQKLTLLSQSANDAVFIATNDTGVAGCLSAHMLELFHVSGKLGRITSLVVDAESRRTGVGRLLIEQSTDFFRRNGCIRVEVNSGDHRPTAHAFYESMGFVQDERRFILKL